MPITKTEAEILPQALTALLTLTESPKDSKVEYVIGGLELTGTDRGAAAQLLADDAMRIRCGESPILERWRARRDGGLECSRFYGHRIRLPID
jgi:hypothetical protein